MHEDYYKFTDIVKDDELNLRMYNLNPFKTNPMSQKDVKFLSSLVKDPRDLFVTYMIMTHKDRNGGTNLSFNFNDYSLLGINEVTQASYDTYFDNRMLLHFHNMRAILKVHPELLGYFKDSFKERIMNTNRKVGVNYLKSQGVLVLGSGNLYFYSGKPSVYEFLMNFYQTIPGYKEFSYDILDIIFKKVLQQDRIPRRSLRDILKYLYPIEINNNGGIIDSGSIPITTPDVSISYIQRYMYRDYDENNMMTKAIMEMEFKRN